MRTRVFFVLLMIVFSVLTLAKYREISRIKSNSKEFTFIISGEEKEVFNLKSNIQGITYQPVYEEKIESGKYRLKIKCPPEKMHFIFNLLSRVEHSEIEQ